MSAPNCTRIIWAAANYRCRASSFALDRAEQRLATVEEWTSDVGGSLLHSKFHPNWCSVSLLEKRELQNHTRVTEIPVSALHASCRKKNKNRKQRRRITGSIASYNPPLNWYTLPYIVAHMRQKTAENSNFTKCSSLGLPYLSLFPYRGQIWHKRVDPWCAVSCRFRRDR